MSTHYDDPHGDVLARALRAEAESIVPAGDGLTKIRDRVAKRRARFRWFLPSASVVTAAALAGIAFGAYTVSSNDDSLRSQQPAHSGSPSGGPSVSQHPSTTPSASRSQAVPPVPTTDAGLTPVWPFNTAADVGVWQQHPGSSPWHLDAGFTATQFVKGALGFGNQDVVVVKDTTTGRRSGYVSLGTRTTASGKTTIFGSVYLTRWGDGPNAPWEVTGVTAPGARIDSPANDGSVSSPLTVRYTLDGGNEDDVTVSLHDGHTKLASTKNTVGGGQQSASLAFGAPATSNGYVVMADLQGGSGTSVLQRLAVTPVRFATPPVSATGPTQKYPAYFVAAKDGRLAVYYAKGGGFARWLTAPAGHFPASAPYVDAAHQWVYYLAGPSQLRRVKVTGGTPETVQTGELQLTAFAIGGASDELIATVSMSSDTASGQPQMSVQWHNTSTGAMGAISFANPDSAEQLAWAPDGRHLAVTVRGGNGWGVRVYDVTTAKSSTDGVALPCPDSQFCSAPSYDAAGNLYVIQGVDAATWKLMQWKGGQFYHVSTWTLSKPVNPETATLDMTPDAEAAVVGTSVDEVYRIEFGKANLLPTQAGAPTW